MSHKQRRIDMKFQLPVINGEVGERYFVFANGRKSKEFYDVSEFDKFNGCYPILDQSGNVVEYMDMLGNFSKTPTEFASKFHHFVFFERYSALISRSSASAYYECAINWFPSKFLISQEIQEIVKEIEKQRFKKMCRTGCFVSIFERVRYFLYMKECMNIKLDKAKQLSQNPKVVNEVNEELSDFIVADM